MAETSIEWTHPPGFRGASWNPLNGCEKISPGCRECYAEKIAARFSKPGQPYHGLVDDRGRWTGVLRPEPHKLADPIRRRAPTCWFVNSMSDLFHDSVPDKYIAAVFGVMAASPRHRFIVLTKRAERMRRWFEWIGQLKGSGGDIANADPLIGCIALAAMHWLGDPAATGRWNAVYNAIDLKAWPLPNVAIGVSCESDDYRHRIDDLRECPAAVRIVSVEPMLAAVDLRGRLGWIHQVIFGGESGRNARACNSDWIRDGVRQCREAGVPAFVKQLGSSPFSSVPPTGAPDDGGDIAPYRLRDPKGGDPSEWPDDLRVREWPTAWAGGER